MKTAETSSVYNSHELLTAISMSSWHHHGTIGNERPRTPHVLFQPLCVCKEAFGIHTTAPSRPS
jgi:hypothetical protein